MVFESSEKIIQLAMILFHGLGIYYKSLFMFKQLRIILMTTICILFSESLSAQKFGALKIGDRLDASIFRKIPRKGTEKIIILDFWGTFCSTCIAAFPKMEQLKLEFKDQLGIVLVNCYESEAQVNKFFFTLNKRREKDKLPLLRRPSLSAINGDTLWRVLFPHSSVPHHVWLNDSGVVLAITQGYNATSGNVQKLLNREPVNLSIKRDLLAEKYDARKKGLMQIGHPELRPITYSVFAPYYSGIGGNSYTTDSAAGTFRLVWLNASLVEMFSYLSLHLPEKPFVLIELKDSNYYSQAKDPIERNMWNQKYRLCYETMVPLEDLNTSWNAVLSDLNRYFKPKYNIEGVSEKRKMRSWVVSVTDKEALMTSRKPKSHDVKGTTHKWTNYPLSSVINFLSNSLSDIQQSIIFMDETGLDGQTLVDMTLSVDKKNISALATQLKTYGIQLQQEERSVNVLAIKEF